MSNEKELRDGILKSMLTAIGLSAGAVITVFGAQVAYNILSSKIFHVVVILIVIFPCFVLVYVYLPPIVGFFKRRKRARDHNRFSKECFNKFNGFVNDFENFIDSKNPVKVIITSLMDHEEFRKYLSGNYNNGVALHLQNTFNHFKRRVNKFNGTKEDFLLLVGEFENLLDIYKALFIDKVLHAVKEVGKDKVKEKHKEKYSEFREYYNDFISNYKAYGKDVNTKFGEAIVRIDIDIAKEL